MEFLTNLELDILRERLNKPKEVADAIGEPFDDVLPICKVMSSGRTSIAVGLNKNYRLSRKIIIYCLRNTKYPEIIDVRTKPFAERGLRRLIEAFEKDFGQKIKVEDHANTR
jgi:hypothetical protein